jgi:hypothetical protein
MSLHHIMTFRVASDLHQDLLRTAKQLRQSTGCRVSLADVIRICILIGLEQRSQMAVRFRRGADDAA